MGKIKKIVKLIKKEEKNLLETAIKVDRSFDMLAKEIARRIVEIGEEEVKNNFVTIVSKLKEFRDEIKELRSENIIKTPEEEAALADFERRINSYIKTYQESGNTIYSDKREQFEVYSRTMYKIFNETINRVIQYKRAYLSNIIKKAA